MKMAITKNKLILLLNEIKKITILNVTLSKLLKMKSVI